MDRPGYLSFATGGAKGKRRRDGMEMGTLDVLVWWRHGRCRPTNSGVGRFRGRSCVLADIGGLFLVNSV
jgi:hypothetical protein